MRFFSLFSMAIKSGIFEWNSPCGGWWWVIVHSASMYTPICACARVRSVCVCVCVKISTYTCSLYTRVEYNIIYILYIIYIIYILYIYIICIYYIYVCVCACVDAFYYSLFTCFFIYVSIYLSIYFCVCTHSRPFGSRTFHPVTITFVSWHFSARNVGRR